MGDSQEDFTVLGCREVVPTWVKILTATTGMAGPRQEVTTEEIPILSSICRHVLPIGYPKVTHCWLFCLMKAPQNFTSAVANQPKQILMYSFPSCIYLSIE